MLKMKKLLILILGIVILANLAYAASFDVKVTSVLDKIVVDETAEFDLTITNNLGTREEFTIKKAGYPFWDMYTKPLQNPITLAVPAQSSATLRIYVHPLYITSVDTYTINAGVVLGSTGEEQKAPLTIGIKSTAPLIGGYIPTILTSVGISPEEIDPREEFTIKITMNNQNLIDYPNLTIKAESNILKDELNEKLGPQEEKIVEIKKKLDDKAAPVTDRLVVAVFIGDRLVVNPIVSEFKIKEYTTQTELPAEHSFLKIRKGIKAESNNYDYKGTARLETTPLKNLMSTTSPRANKIKENGKYYLVWDVKLDSNRSMTVYATENYRPIVVIAVLAIIEVILYFVFRSPIVVRKGTASIGTSEGGVAEAKIVVKVKNRSPNQIANIEVLDNLPHIAHVEKELSIGSMQPHAILKHPKGGLVIRWNIETLEAGDERVLSYKMRSRLPILGEFNLPAATARCKVGNKVIISNSNRVTIGG